MYRPYETQELQNQAEQIERDLKKDIPLVSWRVEFDFRDYPGYFVIIGTLTINGINFNHARRVMPEQYDRLRNDFSGWIRFEFSHALAKFIFNWKPE